jgi:hypothetical protein
MNSGWTAWARAWRWAATGGWCAATLALLTACSLGGNTSDDGSGAPTDGVLVRVQNRTDRPLDPQLYVSPAADGLDNLFSASNKRTDFGVGSVGVLLPDSSAEFPLDCGVEHLLATHGGAFGDDLNNPDGTGEYVVLEQGLNLHCGDVVTFTFVNSGNTLTVTYAVGS